MRQLPLAGHPAVSTISVEEARAILAHQGPPIAIEPLDQRTGFRWLGRRVQLGTVAITAQQYGASFRASSAHTAPAFTASFPLSDVAGEANIAGEAIDIAVGRSTFLSSPSGPRSFRFANGYRGLQLVVGERDMVATVQALTGETPRAPIRFEARMALDTGVGAALDRLVKLAVAEVDARGPLVDSPIVAARFADTVLATLLAGQPHSARHLFEARPHAVEPRHVRRAAEYLDANLSEPIRMTDLAAAAGVSIRALQSAFLKHRGATPMRFLRDRRLDRARQLLSMREGKPVSEIALECGFEHLGRFSAHYLARFGELPSVTRARRR